MSEPVFYLHSDPDGVSIEGDDSSFPVSAHMLRNSNPKFLEVDGNVMTLHLIDGDRRYLLTEGVGWEEALHAKRIRIVSDDTGGLGSLDPAVWGKALADKARDE